MSENLENKIFCIKSTKAIILKNLFEIIKPYIKETIMIVHPEYIKICAKDISKSSVTFIKLDANKFESYHVPEVRQIGLDVVTFFKILKPANRKETITFFIDKDEPEKLGVQLSDLFQGKVKEYKLKLLALDERIPNVNQMDFDYIINMPSTQFQQIIKEIHLLEGKIVEITSIGKQLIFSCTDGIAEFKTSINEIDDSLSSDQKTLLQQNGEEVKSVKFEQHSEKIVQGRFKLSHLMNFMKASHLCDNMSIYLSNDKPLVLHYHVADIGYIRFILISNN